MRDIRDILDAQYSQYSRIRNGPKNIKKPFVLQNKYKKFIFLFFNLNKFISPKKEQLFINKL